MRKNRRPKNNPYVVDNSINNNNPPMNQDPNNFYQVNQNNQGNNNNMMMMNQQNNTNNNNNMNTMQQNQQQTENINHPPPNNNNNPNLNQLNNQFSELSTGGALGIQNSNQIKYSSPLKNYQANDNFFSLSLNQIPQSQQILSKSQIPLGAIIHPMAQGIEVPVVDLGPAGVIRCKNCRAYINPFVEFAEGGRRWRCSFCYFSNEGKKKKKFIK